MSNGFILYRGPSMIDGAPIVVIATGTSGKASRNSKTGDLVQTWILRDDIAPHDATATGDDASICGDCPHRGEIELHLVCDTCGHDWHVVTAPKACVKCGSAALDIAGRRNVGRSCYVTVFQAPLSVYKSFKRGIYETKPGFEAQLLAGRRVRLGSYGDPAAVPFAVWDRVLRYTEAGTGYTHQWRTCDPSFSRYVMASCDNARDYLDARAMGYRTFRVRRPDEALSKGEVVCPASKEAGHKTTCAACVACGGHSAKARANIAIVAHGAANRINAFASRAA